MSRRKRMVLAALVLADLGILAVLAGLVVWHSRLAGAETPVKQVAASPTTEAQLPLAAPLTLSPDAAVPATVETASLSSWASSPTAAPSRPPPPIATLLLSPTPLPTLPSEASIDGVVGRRQSLPLSCESRSAADWAAFFGVDIDELEFLQGLPTSDDPDRGFVGDVDGQWGQIPPAPYGVHAGPVARRLREYGLAAEAHRYLDWDEVRAEIADGRPVIAWVVGHVEPGTPVIYLALDGRRTIVARFEHTVIVTGYTETTVTVVDGARVYTRSLELFLDSWGTLRNMAVTVKS